MIFLATIVTVTVSVTDVDAEALLSYQRPVKFFLEVKVEQRDYDGHCLDFAVLHMMN